MPSDSIVPPSRRTPNFIKYPHPETERVLAHLETLPVVKEETKGYVDRVRLLLVAGLTHARPSFPGSDVSPTCSTTARCVRVHGFRGDRAPRCSCRCSWGARGICTYFSVGESRSSLSLADFFRLGSRGAERFCVDGRTCSRRSRVIRRCQGERLTSRT